MAKLDPNNPIIKIMLMIIVVYMICNFLLVEVYEKDYDHDIIKDKIIKSETKEELQENMEIVHKNTKLRFYLLLGTCGILFILYVFFKYKTNKSEGVALCALVVLGLSGKLIEKLGLANCLTIPVIDPEGKPGNVLLFDMSFTNFFAYFIDFIYAFAFIQVGGSGLKAVLNNNEFIKLLTDNLSIYANGKFMPMNILRFVLYYVVIVIFWAWGSVIRPKVSLLVHRYVGIPVIPKESLENLKLEDNDYPLKEFTTDKLVFTYHTIGIIAAGVVEGLLFTGLLFPMRKYFIYSLDNKMDFVHDKWSVLAKFVSLTLMIPGLIILLTKYTLSDTSDNYKIQKMSAGILTQYIGVPIILFMIQSLLKIPIIETLTKHKKIAGPLFFIVPIILSYLVIYVFKYKGTKYIDETADKEKIMESFMSEQANVGECDESQNKYKYAVAVVTVVFCILCFGPLLYAGKLQPLNGLLLLATLIIILKGVYNVQDNKEEYNILNPMRENANGEIDLDTTTSIATTMACISVGSAALLIFRNIR
tara:strand:+ start:180 stop:1775 length:1596 start_codon:yes stop_codon:yes gene_type:complete